MSNSYTYIRMYWYIYTLKSLKHMHVHQLSTSMMQISYVYYNLFLCVYLMYPFLNHAESPTLKYTNYM